MKVILSHGKEGGPQSRKIGRLKELAEAAGHTVEVPDYREITSPEDRASYLLEFLKDPEEECLLVGSSMGGYISLVASIQSKSPVKGIFLMAPAVFLEGYQFQTFELPLCPIEIIHAWQDETVPFENVIRFAETNRAKLLLVNDDHRLADSLDEIEVRFVRLLERLSTSS